MSRYRWLLALILVLAATALATTASSEGLDIERDDAQTKTTRELEPVTFNLSLK